MLGPPQGAFGRGPPGPASHSGQPGEALGTPKGPAMDCGVLQGNPKGLKYKNTGYVYIDICISICISISIYLYIYIEIYIREYNNDSGNVLCIWALGSLRGGAPRGRST